MDITIITVSYNTRDLLADCLGSTLAGLERSGLDGEVWVVDNASTDGSVEMVRQRFPSVNLIAHDENIGFAAGNNLALKSMGFPAQSRQPTGSFWTRTPVLWVMPWGAWSALWMRRRARAPPARA